MRTKDQILDDIRRNISKAPKESRCLLEHEYCFIEVLTDIRDILYDLSQSIGSNIIDLARES